MYQSQLQRAFCLCKKTISYRLMIYMKWSFYINRITLLLYSITTSRQFNSQQGLSVVINIVKPCVPIKMMPWEVSSNPLENLWRFSLQQQGKKGRPYVCIQYAVLWLFPLIFPLRFRQNAGIVCKYSFVQNSQYIIIIYYDQIVFALLK